MKTVIKRKRLRRRDLVRTRVSGGQSAPAHLTGRVLLQRRGRRPRGPPAGGAPGPPRRRAAQKKKKKRKRLSDYTNIKQNKL